jgi:4-amino-4-deoxy-L-arabinose transferase-like glycosyltransferase
MHGNLSQRLAALPLLVSRPTFDPRRMPKAAEHWDLAENFFYTSGNDPDRLLLAGRIPIVAVTVALGVLVYGWSSAIFGPAGGLVSLAVVLFHPLVLAHGGLVTSDATVSLLFLAAVGGLWRLLQRADVGRLALSILCVGLLLTAKMSAVLIVPMAVLLAAGRIVDGRPWPFRLGQSGIVTSRLGISAACVGLAVIHAAGVVAIIWASYGFRFSAAGPLPGLPELEWQSLLARSDWKMSLIGLARDARLLPEAYLHGLATAFAAVDISPAFLDGRFFLHGSPWYFPLAFIYKTPPTFWLVAVLVLLAAGRSLVVADDRREAIRAATYDRWPLYVILIVYGVVAVRTHFNIGLRHVMPMLPPLAILMGQAAAWRLPGHAWSGALRHPVQCAGRLWAANRRDTSPGIVVRWDLLCQCIAAAGRLPSRGPWPLDGGSGAGLPDPDCGYRAPCGIPDGHRYRSGPQLPNAPAQVGASLRHAAGKALRVSSSQETERDDRRFNPRVRAHSR